MYVHCVNASFYEKSGASSNIKLQTLLNCTYDSGLFHYSVSSIVKIRAPTHKINHPQCKKNPEHI